MYTCNCGLYLKDSQEQGESEEKGNANRWAGCLQTYGFNVYSADEK